jgi:hypothetical protein
MRSREPKPPRFNRYNVYLIASMIVLAPLFAWRGVRKGCILEHAITGDLKVCQGFGDWRWFLATGGNPITWLGCAMMALLLAAAICRSFK